MSEKRYKPSPWEMGPSTHSKDIPSEFQKAFHLTPEQESLVEQVNREIRKRQTYGTREEPLPGPIDRVWELTWSNASAAWFVSGHPIYYKYAPESPEAGVAGYIYRHPTKAGDTVVLDANQVMVQAKKHDLEAIVGYLEPLPLYAYSFEAKQRGFGALPPPQTKHWTWPPLYERGKPE